MKQKQSQIYNVANHQALMAFGMKFLKQVVDHIYKNLLSSSVCTGRCLLQQLKDARIVHLSKANGDKSSYDNYRGISLLSIVGKSSPTLS